MVLSGVALNSRMGALKILAAVLGGCAGVSFYSDCELKHETGIPIYGTKPYVFVVHGESPEKPLKVTIEYLTDLSNVVYAVPRSGFGLSDLKLTLEHGQLTQFGQVTDTKIPETIKSIGELLTSGATAIESLAKAAQTRKVAVGSTAQSAKIPDKDTLQSKAKLLEDMRTLVL